MIPFRVKKLLPEATLPSRAHPDDAGIDIYSAETYTLQPGEVHAFATGMATEFPPGYVALLWDRSGLGSRGVHRLAGVIDAGYRGEWKVVLLNTTRSAVTIRQGDKIVQCIVQKFEPAEIVEVTQVAATGRGARGFGSSGR